MRLPPALRAFLAASALFALLCFGTEAVCRFLLHWPTPWDYPAIRNVVKFPDFHYFFPKFAYFHSPAFYTHSYVLPYPAPALVAIKLFLLPQPLPHHGAFALARFEASLVLASLVTLTLFWRSLVRRGVRPASASLFVLGMYALSFALWFEFSQGNIEWVVWCFLMAGIYAFCTGRLKTAAICIGIAGSMKIFPIIFVGLFLPIHRYRAIFATLATAAVTTLISLWLVCPDVHQSALQTASALGIFAHEHMAQIRPLEGGFDHSLFALIKIALTTLTGSEDHEQALGIYLPVAGLTGCALFFLRIRKLPLPNQVLCLTVAAVVLPPVSYDYTLIHLYAGLILLAFCAIEREKTNPSTKTPGLLPAFLLLAFILSPESEFLVHGVRFSGQLKCVALLALGYVSLRYPFPLASLPADQPLAIRADSLAFRGFANAVPGGI